MIDLQRKELILDRLKEVNDGKIDYLTVDDVIIEPFGLKSMIEPIIKVPRPTKNYPNGYAQFTKDTNIFSGYYGLYNTPGNQKYIIKAKPGRNVTGTFIISMIIPQIGKELRSDFNTYYNSRWRFFRYSLYSLKSTSDNNDKHIGFQVPVYLESNLPFKKELEDYTDEDIISLLPFTGIDTIDIDKITRKHKINEYSSYPNGNYPYLNYLKDTLYDQFTIKFKPRSKNETSISNLYTPNKDSFEKDNYYNWYTNIYVIRNGAIKNARKVLTNNTKHLSLSLEAGEVTLKGCYPDIENSRYSTSSIMTKIGAIPEFDEAIWDVTGDHYLDYRDYRIQGLPDSLQAAIIGYLTKVHHWKWGTQNKPNQYSKIPSTHNLYNAKLIKLDTFGCLKKRWNSSANKYEDYISPIMFGTNSLKCGIHPRSDYPPKPNSKNVIGFNILLDRDYNTGYDGDINGVAEVFARYKDNR